MTRIDMPLASLTNLLPLLLVIIGVAGGIWLLNHFVFDKIEAFRQKRMPKQIGLVALGMVGIVLIILALPISDEMKGQVLSLFGLLLTASIALSSTTVVANAMAGLMLRAMRSFNVGDFIRVDKHFGRVTEKSLFHTEIQTGNRDLTSLPNAYLVTNPVTVVRRSGTIVESSLSLGYDLPHARAEELLLEAADSAGLEEAFVQILDLGNYAVTYRIAGFLSETKRLVSAGTALRSAVLDTLHRAGVEIASPTLMSQRVLHAGDRLLPQEKQPRRKARPRKEAKTTPEDIVFDKAEEAERMEMLRLEREKLHTRLKELKESSDEASAAAIKRCETRLKKLDALLEAE